MTSPQLAISNEFLNALSRIPKAQRKKVHEFTKKFRADPKAAAINYEKIHNMADDRVRTVRIDQKYRAVVLHPNSGHTYVLVWVDNHDEAMDWARNRTFEVHPETQSLQILNVSEVQNVITNTETSGNAQTNLFEQDDKTLMTFGIPEVLLPAVRNIKTKEKLAALKGVMPEEAFEALVWLADGESVEDVKQLVGMLLNEKQVKKTTFADEDSAISGSQSSRRFSRVESDEELDRVLAAPLEKWRVFLHPLQLEISQRSFSGPTLVLGGAGTGKTIVAIHRARKLALKLPPNKRILFTTFTKNLAENVRSVLTTLCGDEIEKIDVQHIHDHAMSWVKTTAPVYIARDQDLASTWDQVAVDNPTDIDVDILRTEWHYAHAIRGITTREEYLQMSRVGRTPSLSRRDRSRVWMAFELFDELLRSAGKTTWVGVANKATELAKKAGQSLYEHIIVDEGQDFTAPDWRFTRSLVKQSENDLFIVADPRQRIYHEPTMLSDGDVRIKDRIHRLQINYRTTEQIRLWATARSNQAATSDLCKSSWSTISTHSLLRGPEPVLLEHEDHESESEAIADLVLELNETVPLEEIAIVVRAKWLLNKVKKSLKKSGIEFHTLDAHGEQATGVRLATMHRVKGLEFRCVIIAGLSDAIFPTKYRGRPDDHAAIQRHTAAEQNLLYVAASRARDQLYVSTVGGFATSKYLTD